MPEYRSLSERRTRDRHFAGYALYQSVVQRIIPVLVLEPRD
jgi:hypothetical protein